MTELEIRNNYVNTAREYYGDNEADGSHKKIIDLYNSHKPLARGYKVKYTDAWCATFVSAIAIKCGLTDIIPTECSCSKMIALFKKLGRWKEADNYIPQPGDIIMYDWDDSGNGDNTGDPDHVGIVVNVTNDVIRIIEGNMNNKVWHRDVKVNGKRIRGYCLPDFASKATVEEKPKEEKPKEEPTKPTGGKKATKEVAMRVINGEYGDGQERKLNLSADGYWPDEVQALVNELLAETKQRVHTVVRGDTLWSIADKYLGNGSHYPEIMKLNGLTSTMVHPNQKLKIPTK